MTSHIDVLDEWMNYEKSTAYEKNDIISYFANVRNEKDILQYIDSNADKITHLMKKMQDWMGIYPVGDSRHRGLQRNLYTLQTSSGRLLPKLELKHGEVQRVSDDPVGYSADFDIWEGKYLGQKICAIKVVRDIKATPKIHEPFMREVAIWRKVWEVDKGEYMLPFWGACLSDGPYPQIVSPWMEYGDAISYVNKYPYVNRKRIIRRVAEGMRVLHTYNPPIAHGDIKGANILIDSKGNPLLADFGFSKMIENLTGEPFTQRRGASESYRWFAPELCSDGDLSPASDVYAYSMTVLELMTGQPPFSHIRRPSELLINMLNGDRPRRPDDPKIVERGLDDRLWNLLKRCWVAKPEDRPTIHEVIAELPPSD